ncbi:MAG: insulinase family protein [bacterium]|nr:MAG: insulinase family protein [bacterium]
MNNVLKKKSRKMKPPIDASLLEFKFPELMESRLSSGLNLLIIERPELPKVYLRFGMNVGQKSDPDKRAGLSQLVANTIKKGTRSKSYSEIVQTIEQVGGELDTLVNEDFFVIHAEFLKDYVKTGLELMSDVIQHPSFPEPEMEKERYKQVADLENEKSSPDFLSQRRIEKAIFIPHPYGTYKTQQSLQEIQHADLVHFHEQFFGPQNSFLVMAGDITAGEAEGLAGKFFGKWSPDNVAVREFPNPVPLSKQRIQLVHRPGSEQSHILIGNILFPRNHPDFVKMSLLNKILGGGGSGRLFMNLREEKGYTYGAYSSLLARKESGAFIANAEVRTEVTLPAIEAFHEEFDRIKQEVVPADELKNAKRFLRGIFPLQNETAAAIASLALRQRLYELGDDYWNRYQQKIEAVTAKDIQKTAQKYLPEQGYVIVIVGDAEKLEKSLQALGEVEIYDLNDQKVN